MSDGPFGWVESTLGDLCEVVSGSTPRTGVPQYWGGDIPWITPDDLSGYTRKTIAHGRRALTQAGYDSCSTRLVPAGTVLFTSRAPIGHVAIAAQRVCTNQGFKSFVPSEALTSDYLYWFLKFTTPQIRKLGSGTTFPELSKTRALEITIPVAPLNEQRRIVAAIEEQFSRLDAADESLRRAGAGLAGLRASTLFEALEGLPTATLGAVAAVNSGPAFKSEFFGASGEGIRLLRGENIEPGCLRWREVRTWPEAMLDGYEHLFVAETDLILAMDRPVISSGLKLAPVRAQDLPALLVQRVARIRPGERVVTRFLHLALQLPRFVPHLLGGQTGTQLPHITLAGIRTFNVPSPPLEDQRRIVAEVEQRLSQIDALRAAIEAAQRRSAALRRSILERAFRGELVPQDPSDEPASALLERIAAERATAETANGGRPRRRATMQRS